MTRKAETYDVLLNASPFNVELGDIFCFRVRGVSAVCAGEWVTSYRLA